MKTIVVSIGNSDNKLTQQEWSRFVDTVDKQIRWYADTVHFMGGAANWMPWQNVAWIADFKDERLGILKELFVQDRERFEQDAIAWLEGETQFI